MMLKAALILVMLSSLSACGASQAKTANLLDEVHAYNDGVRWRQYPKAAARIHPKERSEFIAEINSLEDELKISDWELIHLDNSGHKDQATALVRYTWYLDSEGIVHTTSTKQTWKLHGKQWLVTKELRIKGEAMPGVDEPEEDEDSESESEDGGVQEDGGKSESAGSEEDNKRSGGGKLSLRHMIVEFR